MACNCHCKHTAELFPVVSNEVDRRLIKSGIKVYLRDCFRIPVSIVTRYLSYYKLVYWSGSYILNEQYQGLVVRDGIEFSIVYGSGLSRGAIHRAPDEQYAVSFRAAIAELELQPIAYISEAN